MGEMHCSEIAEKLLFNRVWEGKDQRHGQRDITWIIQTPAEATGEVIDTINENPDIPENLTNVLQGISDILNDANPNNDKAACGKLNAFINQVNQQEIDGTLSAAAAESLRQSAEAIKISAGCKYATAQFLDLWTNLDPNHFPGPDTG